MLARTCNSYRIKQIEKIIAEVLQQILHCAFCRRQLRPMIIGCLRITENIIYRIFGIQLIINFAAITLIGQLKLILQIVKAIINGSSRKHQHLCLHALTKLV